MKFIMSQIITLYNNTITHHIQKKNTEDNITTNHSLSCDSGSSSQATKFYPVRNFCFCTIMQNVIKDQRFMWDYNTLTEYIYWQKLMIILCHNKVWRFQWAKVPSVILINYIYSHKIITTAFNAADLSEILLTEVI